MALLKKVRSSTILETLVASSILLAVFVIGTMSINNIFLSTLKNENHELKTHLSELEYLIIHKNLALPFYEDTDGWDISIESKGTFIELNVLNKKNQKSSKKQIGV